VNRPVLHWLSQVDALKRRTAAWSLRLRVNPRVVRVQEMRTKWGSCSTKGVIALSRDLADTPPRFQDFVIVHELLHLRIQNHGRLFKSLMTAHVPGWRAMDAMRRIAPVRRRRT